MDMMYKGTSFESFLDLLLSDKSYCDFVTALRQIPEEKYYKKDMWHSVEDLLEPFPDAIKALHGYGFHGWDKDFSFSSGDLKACYIIDEDFVNGGRAFVLFNLVASNWVYVGQINEQISYWEVEKV